MKKRKAINFDLSTQALKKHFGENTATAYAKIKDFMLENGFEHRQYSGYASKEVMNDSQVASLAEKMSHKFSWLRSCIQEFDVTDIGEQYSLSHIFRESITMDKTLEASPSKENSQQQYSLNAQEALKQKIAQFVESKDFKAQYNTTKKKDRDRER